MVRIVKQRAVHDLPVWKNILFSLLPLIMLGLLGEVALRIYRGDLLSLQSRRSEQLDLLKSNYPAAYDERLGYVPRPGFSGTGNVWHTTVNIDDQGLRSNGTSAPAGTSTILAVGDSFTFGDEVSDHETWPAHLESLANSRVLNAGVFGYGVGQIVLRAEALVPVYNPGIVIVAVVPDDVRRAELSNRFAWKPYFEIDDETIVLRNIPVPTEYPSQTVQDILGYSHLADFVLSRIAPAWWLTTTETIRAHEQGPMVARQLVDRLRDSSMQYDYRLILVILDEGGRDSEFELVEPMVERAQELRIEVINLIPRLRTLEADPAVKAQWRAPFKHMTSEGNQWIATQIRERL